MHAREGRACAGGGRRPTPAACWGLRGVPREPEPGLRRRFRCPRHAPAERDRWLPRLDAEVGSRQAGGPDIANGAVGRLPAGLRRGAVRPCFLELGPGPALSEMAADACSGVFLRAAWTSFGALNGVRAWLARYRGGRGLSERHRKRFGLICRDRIDTSFRTHDLWPAAPQAWQGRLAASGPPIRSATQGQCRPAAGEKAQDGWSEQRDLATCGERAPRRRRNGVDRGRCVKRVIEVVSTAVVGAPGSSVWTRAFCIAIAATPTCPPAAAMAHSRRTGPSLRAEQQEPQQDTTCSSRSASRAARPPAGERQAEQAGQRQTSMNTGTEISWATPALP